MGYLNNSTITVDAILTRRGRELLAKGRNEFDIRYFALADDEIDYRLWNNRHSKGTAYFGELIEQLPITEAVPDESQLLKYKLVTLPRNTTQIPIVSVSNTNITLRPGETAAIIPQTSLGSNLIDNRHEGNSTYGYTVVLSDTSALRMVVTENSKATGAVATPPSGYIHSDSSTFLRGHKFEITGKSVKGGPRHATITVIGNETGGQTVINVTIEEDN